MAITTYGEFLAAHAGTASMAPSDVGEQARLVAFIAHVAQDMGLPPVAVPGSAYATAQQFFAALAQAKASAQAARAASSGAAASAQSNQIPVSESSSDAGAGSNSTLVPATGNTTQSAQSNGYTSTGAALVPVTGEGYSVTGGTPPPATGAAPAKSPWSALFFGLGLLELFK